MSTAYRIALEAFGESLKIRVLRHEGCCPDNHPEYRRAMRQAARISEQKLTALANVMISIKVRVDNHTDRRYSSPTPTKAAHK